MTCRSQFFPPCGSRVEFKPWGWAASAFMWTITSALYFLPFKGYLMLNSDLRLSMLFSLIILLGSLVNTLVILLFWVLIFVFWLCKSFLFLKIPLKCHLFYEWLYDHHLESSLLKKMFYMTIKFISLLLCAIIFGSFLDSYNHTLVCYSFVIVKNN